MVTNTETHKLSELTMDEYTEKAISEWDKDNQNKIVLSLITNKSRESILLENFCEKLSVFAPSVIIEKSKSGSEEGPYIKTEHNLIFKAVPEGKMLNTFLSLLTLAGPPDSESISSCLKDFMTPVSLSIFISPHCPFCPKVVSDVSRLPLVNKNIEVVIIDGSLFPELAQKNRVVSAPTVIFNEHFIWTGQVNAVTIAEVLGNSKPEDLSVNALRTIIENGKAKVLADLMIRADIIFPAFIDLITHEKWPVRLGAMVTLEEINEENPNLADKVFSTLWLAFASYNPSVKGDIIYITGESGKTLYTERIKDIMHGDYSEDLKEASREAIESMAL